MRTDIRPPVCKGPLNAAPWLSRFLSWRYVCSQPSTCCGLHVRSCPVSALLQFDDRNAIISLKPSLNDITDGFCGSDQVRQPD